MTDRRDSTRSHPAPADVDLDRCVAGDGQAWVEFVDRYSGVIWAAVRRTSRGRAPGGIEINDLVQDVFTRLLREECRLLRSYDADRSTLATWLALISRSLTIDRLRRRRVEEVPLEDRAEAAGTDPGRRPEPGVEVPWHLLTARQRLVLRLLFDEERSVSDVARMLGVDDQTIRSTKHKALSRLRGALQPQAGPDPTSA